MAARGRSPSFSSSSQAKRGNQPRVLTARAVRAAVVLTGGAAAHVRHQGVFGGLAANVEIRAVGFGGSGALRALPHSALVKIDGREKSKRGSSSRNSAMLTTPADALIVFRVRLRNLVVARSRDPARSG